MTDIQLRWYTVPSEPEPEQVNMSIVLQVGQRVNNISIGIPVLARVQLDIEV